MVGRLTRPPRPSKTASLCIAWLAVCFLAAPSAPPQAIKIAESIDSEIQIATKLALENVEVGAHAVAIDLSLPSQVEYLRIELLNADRQLLFRRLLAAPGPHSYTGSLPYQVSVSQTAILLVSQQDKAGRTLRLVSREVSLLAEGDEPGSSTASQTHTLELSQAELSAYGSLQLTGLVTPAPASATIQIQLIDQDKSVRINVNRYISEDGSFVLEVPGYTPQQAGDFLLTVAHLEQGQIRALDSALLRLSP